MCLHSKSLRKSSPRKLRNDMSVNAKFVNAT